MKKKIRFGFTLVEMLIVVVIIGILAGAILPRITGYLAKTRDMKRQVDLRNIAAAVQMYKNQKGYFPFLPVLSGTDMMGYIKGISSLKKELIDYITEIPKPPQNHDRTPICIPAHQYMCKGSIFKTDYLYLLKLQGASGPLEGMKPIATILAKVETPDAANYVFLPQNKQKFNTNGFPIGPRSWLGTAFWVYNSYGKTIYPAWTGPKFHTCSKVEKGTEAKRSLESDGSYHCSYTAIDQLYYVVVLE